MQVGTTPEKTVAWNRLGLDYRRPMPRPKVQGMVVDYHTHILGARHARVWFEAAAHYGIDRFVTMTPLEEAVGLARDYGDTIRFIAVPSWQGQTANYVDDWLRRVEMFYNLGSRIVKFHMAPGTMASRGWRLDSQTLRPVLKEAWARGMAVMTHVGDPDLWYHGKYAEVGRFGTREDHYKMLESVLAEHPADSPWIGAHLGGNPENLARIQGLLDRHANLLIDCSATKWVARELSKQRDEAREFFVRNADRILFGTDQVTGDDRGFDFLASRFWVHRKMWETAYIGPSPIDDGDVSEERQPLLQGLALPNEVLQKLYHDNAVKLLDGLGMGFKENAER